MSDGRKIGWIPSTEYESGPKDITEGGKYYLPDISELHIGAEYEFLENHGSPDEKWVQKTLTRAAWGNSEEDSPYLGNSLLAIQRWDDNFWRPALRIKKLNQDDLEELGWTFIRDCSWNGEFYGEFKLNDFLLYLPRMRPIPIIIFDDGKDTEYKSMGTVYNGLCRSKSHLRQLMDDLGIAS